MFRNINNYYNCVVGSQWRELLQCFRDPSYMLYTVVLYAYKWIYINKINYCNYILIK